MLNLRRRLLPAIMLAPLALLTACASNTQPVDPAFTGTWQPPASWVRRTLQMQGGITKVEFQGNDVVVDWAWDNQRVTLSRSALQGASTGQERWAGGVILADGTRAIITLTCPVPTGRQLTCQETTQGTYRMTDWQLVLNRSPQH